MDWQFSPVDIVFTVIALFLAIRGIFRGFITEFLSMAAVLLGLTAAVLFTKPIALGVAHIFGQTIWVQIVTFLVLFLGVYIIVKVIEGGLQRGVEKLHLKNLDRVLGFLLGLFEGILLIAFALFLAEIQPFFDIDPILSGSFYARIILPLLVPAATWLNTVAAGRIDAIAR
jgi:membrane protein required for colicin V production